MRLLHLALIALLSAGAIAAPIQIASLPVSISAPGEYRLASTLSYPHATGHAVVIAANDVTLDLGGHALVGNAGTGTIAFGVWCSGRTNVRVRNGSIRGFYCCGYLGGSGHEMANLSVTPTYLGLWIDGRAGRIRDCTVSDAGGSTLASSTRPMGFKAIGPGMRVEHCSVVGMTVPAGGEVVGLHLDRAGGTVVSDCSFSLAVTRSGTYGAWVNAGGAGETSALFKDCSFARWGHGIVGGYAETVVRDTTMLAVTIPYAGTVRDAGQNR